MTRFIWGIDISGNLSYTDDTLKRFLSSENVKDGMKKSDVNCRKIVQDLRKSTTGSYGFLLPWMDAVWSSG